MAHGELRLLLARTLTSTYPERVTTARLELRRWRDSDRDALAAVWADPAVLASLRPDGGDPDVLAAESLARQLRHWDEHGFGLWVVVHPESGEVIGWTGASHPTFMPELADEIEIGWVLRRAHWGRGLATEAGRASLDTAVSRLAPPRVISIIHRDNERSIAVARRLGLVEAGDIAHPEGGVPVRVYERTITGTPGPATRASRRIR